MDSPVIADLNSRLAISGRIRFAAGPETGSLTVQTPQYVSAGGKCVRIRLPSMPSHQNVWLRGLLNWFQLSFCVRKVRMPAPGMICGTLLGILGAVGQRLYFPALSEPMQLVLMTLISFGGTIVGSLLTAPTSRDVLVNFYRTTRPFGWWAPLRAEFQGAARAAIDRENRNDIITLPFALLWLVTMLLLPMQLVIKSYGAFWCTLPLFLLALTGMYFFWWKPLMKNGPATQGAGS